MVTVTRVACPETAKSGSKVARVMWQQFWVFFVLYWVRMHFHFFPLKETIKHVCNRLAAERERDGQHYKKRDDIHFRSCHMRWGWYGCLSSLKYNNKILLAQQKKPTACTSTRVLEAEKLPIWNPRQVTANRILISRSQYEVVFEENANSLRTREFFFSSSAWTYNTTRTHTQEQPSPTVTRM